MLAHSVRFPVPYIFGVLKVDVLFFSLWVLFISRSWLFTCSFSQLFFMSWLSWPCLCVYPSHRCLSLAPQERDASFVLLVRLCPTLFLLCLLSALIPSYVYVMSVSLCPWSEHLFFYPCVAQVPCPSVFLVFRSLGLLFSSLFQFSFLIL